MRALPSATVHVLLLHLTPGRNRWRRRGNSTRGRVDDGDSIARALRKWLVDLRCLSCGCCRLLEGWRKVARGRREKELRGRLYLLLKRGMLGRAAGEG